MQGEALKSLFVYSTKKMTDLGTLTTERAEEHLRVLDDDIKGAG
jgi:hypothetical protein